MRVAGCSSCSAQALTSRQDLVQAYHTGDGEFLVTAFLSGLIFTLNNVNKRWCEEGYTSQAVINEWINCLGINHLMVALDTAGSDSSIL